MHVKIIENWFRTDNLKIQKTPTEYDELKLYFKIV